MGTLVKDKLNDAELWTEAEDITAKPELVILDSQAANPSARES